MNVETGGETVRTVFWSELQRLKREGVNVNEAARVARDLALAWLQQTLGELEAEGDEADLGMPGRQGGHGAMPR